MPKLLTPGKRVAWWREYRGMTRPQLALKADVPYSTLSDFEDGRTKHTMKRLHAVCAVLGLRQEYVQSDKGEPEAEYAQDPAPEPWPFEHVARSRVDRLNAIERRFAEDRLHEALAEIEAERRKSKRTGS